MSRVRADDYQAKSKVILDQAAALFSEVGFPQAKLQDVAALCGATKSMLYHYFPNKDVLLLALLSEHLERLAADLDHVVEQPLPPEDRFRLLVRTYVLKSAQSRQRHVTAMNDVKYLPPEMRRKVEILEKGVVDRVTRILVDLHPRLDTPHYKPYALLLLGMLNWTDLWYKSAGPMSEDELCERISRLFLTGILAQTTSA